MIKNYLLYGILFCTSIAALVLTIIAFNKSKGEHYKKENKLEIYFWNHNKKLKVHKWHHYLKIYDRHFRKFIGKNPTILEIGVSQGGSLEMWNNYFDNKCQIFGIDIIPDCMNVPKKLNVSNIHIAIGDQEDREFWKKYLKDKPKFDIVIEDGGHTMKQQIVTFEEVYKHVSDNGSIFM